MSWQPCCHDMCKIVTWSDYRFSCKSNTNLYKMWIMSSKTVWAMGPCMPEGRLILISSLTSIYNSNFIMINTPWCAYLMYVYCVNCHYCNNDLFSWQYITPIQAKLFFACSCINDCYECTCAVMSMACCWCLTVVTNRVSTFSLQGAM